MVPSKANHDIYIIFALLFSLISLGCSANHPNGAERHFDKLAFVGANVIPMTSDTLLMDYTVLVNRGYIEQLAPTAQLEVPNGYRIVSLDGRYLMPGLTDMHVHISDKTDMARFFRHGITTVRNMSDLPWWAKTMGFPSVLQLRKQQKHGKVFGPRIYTCGMTLDGEPPVSPMNRRILSSAEAREEVSNEKQKGYDAVKLYDNLSYQAYRAIVDEAKRLQIPVVGHVPHSVPLDTVLKDRLLSIEHLTGYIDNNIADYAIDDDRLTEYLDLTRNSGVYNVPTLTVWASLPGKDGYEKLKQDIRFKELPWQVKWMWKKALPYYYDIEFADKANYASWMLTLTMNLTKRLYDAGCPLLIGTDTNIAGTFVGEATHLEMELFVKCGIPEYETLRSATLLPAKALGIDGESGTLEPGKRADLLVLDKNPLVDIRNIRTTFAVYANCMYWEKGP